MHYALFLSPLHQVSDVPAAASLAMAALVAVSIVFVEQQQRPPVIMALTPTAKQQEQLDKYGPTPETSMEMLFDKLESTDLENDPRMKEFLEQPGGDEWKELLTGLKQNKQRSKASPPKSERSGLATQGLEFLQKQETVRIGEENLHPIKTTVNGDRVSREQK